MNKAPKAILFINDQYLHADTDARNVRCLQPLLDKPFLQCVVESLVQLECKDFHIFLGGEPLAIRNFIGNGERWGINAHYHYYDSNSTLSENISRLNLDQDDCCWLASSNELPKELALINAQDEFLLESILHHRVKDELIWSGWAYFSYSTLLRMTYPIDSLEFNKEIRMDKIIFHNEIAPPYSVELDESLLAANIDLLARKHPIALVKRNGSIHPSAKIIGSVLICEDVKISANCKVGPGVVIGPGAFIDEGSELRNTLVIEKTYVGKNLVLEDSIVSPSKLICLRNQTFLEITDEHILASTEKVSGPPRKSDWIFVSILKVLLWPIYLLLKNYKFPDSLPTQAIQIESAKGPEHNICALKLDRNSSQLNLAHGDKVFDFIHCFYPCLLAYPWINLQLFGPIVRSTSSIERLPEKWQDLYRQNTPGLLNESTLDDSSMENELSHAQDAFAVIGLEWTVKLRIVAHYVRTLFIDAVKISCIRIRN